jgi:uncharacterized membrane protein
MALSEAIIATYMTIHMARSPGSHSGRIASPCQEFREGAEILRVWLSGNERTRSFCPIAKISAFAAHSWASGYARLELKGQIGVVVVGWDWGTGGMGEIFHFAFMRRRVRHGALTMRLRSHVRSAVKTASWRAFAAVDTFGLVWLFSGHDTTHAIAAAGAVVGVEAITKSFLYFAHERLWEAPLLR